MNVYMVVLQNPGTPHVIGWIYLKIMVGSLGCGPGPPHRMQSSPPRLWTIFNRESQPKPSFTTGMLGGGHICMWTRNLSNLTFQQVKLEFLKCCKKFIFADLKRLCETIDSWQFDRFTPSQVKQNIYLDDLRVRCWEKNKTYSPKWWFDIWV